MCVTTVGEIGSIFKNSLMLFCLAVVLFVIFTRTQMGSSLYELDLELFEDVDSEVGNYFIVGTWTDIFISTVLVLLRGFFRGLRFSSLLKNQPYKFQFDFTTVDK